MEAKRVFPHECQLCFRYFFAGDLAHALRFLASVVSQSFLAFGDILQLHRKFLELSGGINRIFELEEFVEAAQSGRYATSWNIYFLCRL